MSSAPPLRVLLTGGAGQVGSALRRLAPRTWQITAPTRAELDITDAAAVGSLIASKPWSVVVNAAAYTAVDKAETEVEAAWRVNALAPAVLAKAAAAAGVPIIHLSTDYVFDGDKPSPYLETDPVAPVSVYGASKEGGEQAVRTAGGRHVILRTAWVVSPDGNNFVKTMLRLAERGGPLRVVDDQRGSPTSAEDIARTIITVAERLVADAAAPTGTYHCVNSGEATWFEVARHVFDIAGRSDIVVTPITTAEYPTPTRRPANSRLSTAKLERDFGITLPPWQGAVAAVVRALLREQEKARP